MSPTSFRIILRLCLVSKILERIVATGLVFATRSMGLTNPNQCGCLPGLSTFDACLTLVNDVKTLQGPRLKVSFRFLHMKAGFDKVDNPTLAPILREGRIPPYEVFWVASFLGHSSCSPAPVNLWAPQGSPISALLFLIYLAPLHFRIPRGLMLSYLDDFGLPIVSLSYRRNIHPLQ